MRSTTGSLSVRGHRHAGAPGPATLLGVSLGTNIAGLALPLALVHVYDRIIPNAAGGTALVLFSAVAVALLAEAFLRYVRGVALAQAGAAAEARMAGAAAQAALTGRMAPERAGLVFALIARARDPLGAGLAAALYDAPFALLFLLLVWLIAGPVVLVPLAVAGCVTALAAWTARHHGATGMAAIASTEAHQHRWRALLGAPEAMRAQGVAVAGMVGLAETRRAAALATERHEAANAALLELGQVGGLAITIGVLALGAPIALAGGLSTGGLGAVTMLSSRAGGMLIALAMALVRQGLVRRAQAALDAAVAAPAAGGAWAAAPGEVRLFDAAEEAQADAALRAAAGPDAVLVPAMPALLRGTLLENLTLFDPSRTDAARDMAGRIGLDRMLGRLAQGWHARIGETGRGPLPPGGVKRVALVAACLQRPRVLLLERPEMGLDAAGVAALAEILRDWAQQGGAIGMTTHAPALRALAEGAAP